MLPVFLLIAIEKIINFALATDPITQAGLSPLSGKVMRLVMREPNIEFDTFFNEEHLRFEPVPKLPSPIFEPKGTDLAKKQTTDITKADCTVTVQSPSDLLRLLGEPEGNLPIEGDYKVLMQVKTLVAGFDPDIAGKLQPIIGLPLASQLSGILENLKSMIGNPVKNIVETATNADTPPAQERDELKQELLKLRADIEREQARLEMIKLERIKKEQPTLS